MYDITHFHSTTHEVLCITSGRAKLCMLILIYILTYPSLTFEGFGGEDNPFRIESLVEPGDVVVIPAGVGHRLLDDFSSEFEMVGSYPNGKSWDMCYGHEDEEERVKNIDLLAWFERDPLYGEYGPVLDVTT